MAGPGTELHRLIAQRTGESPTPTCKCGKWIKKMDKRGVAWCKQNIDFIVAALMREAKQRATQWRAVPVDEKGGLLNAAWNQKWKGAFLIPGSGVLLEVLVRHMVFRAIAAAEKKK
jgi:hypothetical protein